MTTFRCRMRIVEHFFTKSERLVFKELLAIASDNSFRVYPKVRLSDVISRGKAYLSPQEFSLYTRAHFDFLIVDSNNKPVLAVEYDGPTHRDVKQTARDEIKNSLCRNACMPLLRVNANHVIRQFRGMTLLRWIIEVMDLEEAFYDAQKVGQIAWDEPFDPMFMDVIGGDRRFPYWLSADETTYINSFLRKSKSSYAWVGLRGSDASGNIHHLEYIRTGDKVVFTKTAVRSQQVEFPIYDLSSEVAAYEMGQTLRAHLAGHHASCSWKAFKSKLEILSERFGLRLSHSNTRPEIQV